MGQNLAVAVALAAASFAFASPTLAADVQLTCPGFATVDQETSSTARISGDVEASVTETQRAAREVPERISIEFNGGAARIRLPRAMIPTINSGGSDGWWPLSAVAETDTELSGTFRLNVFNKPSVRVDRITGGIEVQSGLMRFRGTCESVVDAPRKF